MSESDGGDGMSEDDVLNLDQVAASLQISREQVRQLCIRGKMPYVDAGTGSRVQYRIRVDDLAEFKKSRRHEATVSLFERARGRRPLPSRHHKRSVSAIVRGKTWNALSPAAKEAR